MARIVGNQRNNDLEGGRGDDTILGLGGQDTLAGFEGDDRLEGGEGDDVLQTDEIDGGRDTDRAEGGTGADTIFGGYGADTLAGGDGDDLIHLAMVRNDFDSKTDPAQDEISGGAGYDIAEITAGSDAKTVDLGVAGQISVDGAVVARTSGIEVFVYEAEDSQRIIGSAVSEDIGGSFGNDTIQSGLGDDALRLDGGSDRAQAGRGDDFVGIEVDGSDRVDLGRGDDTLSVDVLLGGASGRPSVYEGGGGQDRLVVIGRGREDVRFDGETLRLGGREAAIVNGFDALDIRGSRITGLSGDDSIEGTAGDDRLLGLGGNDVIEAGDFDEGDASDTIFGGGGDDLIEAYGGGGDRLSGGAGTDRLEFFGDSRSMVMSGSFADGLRFETGNAGVAIATGFESLDVDASDGDDRLFGGALGDSFSLHSGGDRLKAGDGDDRVSLDLDSARDRIDLGHGDDTAVIDARETDGASMRLDGANLSVMVGGDLVSTVDRLDHVIVAGGEGRDLLVGADGSDLLSSGLGRNDLQGNGGDDGLQIALDDKLDRVDGGAGDDQLELIVDRDATAAIVTGVSADGNLTVTQDGVVVLEAISVEAVAIADTRGDDLLIGQVGDDLLESGVGDDTLSGGAGDDTLTAADGRDSIFGGEGSDTVSFDLARTFDGVTVTLLEAETVTATYADDSAQLEGVENVIGSYSHDRITGDAGDNVIDGGRAGSDTLDGGDGNDTLSFDARDDYGVNVTLAGAKSARASEGGVWTDVVRNFENVVGSDINDTIGGDGGDNRLAGGDGYDVLTGGAGADLFLFDAERFDAFDQVRDFSSAQDDRLDLRALVDDLADGASLSFKGRADFSGAAGEVRYEATGGFSRVLADLDGDGRSDVTLRLDGHIELTERDFVLS